MTISAQRRAEPLPIELLQHSGVAQHQSVLQRRILICAVPHPVKRQQHGESLQLRDARQRQDITGPRLVGTFPGPAGSVENNIFTTGQGPQRIHRAGPFNKKRTRLLAFRQKRPPHRQRRVAAQMAQGKPPQPLRFNGGDRYELAATGMASRAASRRTPRARDCPSHALIKDGAGLDQRREPGETRSGFTYPPQGQHRHSDATLRDTRPMSKSRN